MYIYRTIYILVFLYVTRKILACIDEKKRLKRAFKEIVHFKNNECLTSMHLDALQYQSLVFNSLVKVTRLVNKKTFP